MEDVEFGEYRESERSSDFLFVAFVDRSQTSDCVCVRQVRVIGDCNLGGEEYVDVRGEGGKCRGAAGSGAGVEMGRLTERSMGEAGGSEREGTGLAAAGLAWTRECVVKSKGAAVDVSGDLCPSAAIHGVSTYATGLIAGTLASVGQAF